MTGDGDAGAGSPVAAAPPAPPPAEAPPAAPAPPRRRRNAAETAATVLALAGWCGFAWYVFWQGTAGVPIIWTDSTSYATVAGHPLWSTGFWAGQRPPLVPFVLKLVNSPTGFTALQSVVAVAAWGFLAFTVGRLVAPGWRRVVAVFVVLGFASTTPITLWNRSVLSESFSLSILAVLMASTIWAARRLTWPRVAAVLLSALAFAATRDAQVWTVGLLAVVVIVVTAVRGVRTRRLPVRPSVLAAGLVVTVALTGWVGVHTGRTRQNVANVLYVRVFPFPARVAWFAAHGMPAAREIDRTAATTAPPGPGAVKVIDPGDPVLDRWIADHGETTYLLWLVTHPGYVVAEPLVRPERAFNFADGNLIFYASPVRAPAPMTPVLWPTWWWLLPMAALGLGTAAATGRWRERTEQALVLLAGLGLLTMLIAWHGDGQEVTRHAIEGFAELRGSVVILATVGVLRLPPRRRAPSPPDGAVTP